MDFITAFSRFAIPLITIMILVKCIMTLLLGHPTEKTYGYIINMLTGDRYELNVWETSIGRSPSCDVVINSDSVMRFQAVISRRIDGWYIYDLFTRTEIKVNGQIVVKKDTISPGDIISFGELKFRFDITNDPVQRVGKMKKKKKKSSPEAPTQRPSQPLSEQMGNPVYPQQSYTPIQPDMNSASMRRGSYTIETPQQPAQRVIRTSQPFIVNKDTGEKFILCGTEVTIGSGRRCDITLRSNRVAKLHAVLVLYEDGWAIENACAMGTALNGNMISSPQLLFDSDVIALGDERLHFHNQKN